MYIKDNMKIYKILSVALLTLIMPVMAFAQLTVPQGGTGQTAFTAGYIPYGGSSSLRLDREAAFFYTPSLNRLTIDNASTTALSATSICLSSDCRTAWPTSGGGGGSISTSTTPTPGNLAYWTSVSELSSIATGTLSESVTGLEFSASRGLVGGASALSLTSGYVIPLSASTTEWSNFYTTPSTRITAGANCSWAGNTFNCTGGTSSGLATSSPWTNGNLAYVTGLGTVGSVATGTLTETVTGLELNATRALVGGSAILAITSGYEIPLSASTTQWSGFYNTPSTRITAGNGLSWSGNTLTATSTHAAVTLSGALDYITLVGQDIVRGAIDLATDITGALGIANGGLGAAFTDPNADRLMFWDDSSGFITGIATLAGAAISGTTLTINDVTCTDCLGPTEITDSYLLNNGDVGTGAYDFGGATTFEIPNGTAPTATGVGEIAHDTTGNQLIVDDYIVPLADQAIWSVTIASTSPRFISSGNYPVPTKLDGYTITRIQCHVTSGTSKVIAIEDASGNSSEDITCATTNTTDDGSITNATYTASELQYIDFGATTGAVDYVSISVFGNWTRE